MLKNLRIISLCLPFLCFLSCDQEKANEQTQESSSASSLRDTVDSTIFSKRDKVKIESDSLKGEFLADSVFGYYRAFVPASFLLDDNGKTMMSNNNPIRVPANILYLRLFRGTAYGVQVSAKNKFLFTGPYSYSEKSGMNKGSLILMLNGKLLKTGKDVGEWTPVIEYMKQSDGKITFILKGTSGSPDAKFEFIKRDLGTSELQLLLEKEVKNL